jgi:HD-GYP domain-containing protein (c-di-GMP phosphodiesterase class II)
MTPESLSTQTEQIRNLSEELQFLYSLHMLINSAKVYGDNNHLLISAVENFLGVIAKFAQEDDEITFFASSGRFYLQLEKIIYPSKLASLVNTMLAFFEKRKIKGLRFYLSTLEAPVNVVASFARLLNQCLNEEDSPDWLEAQLDADEFAWVDPVPLSDTELENAIPVEDETKTTAPVEEELPEEEKDKEQEKKRKALQAYGYALNSLQEISQKVSSDKNASIKKALRMVHIMIDTVMDDNNVLLSLSTIRDYDDYTFTHSLNVAILSMCLGHRIGLSKKLLETLSLSAMFHDLGKIDVPKNILNKPGKLSDHEFKEMRNHSIYSVRQIILLKASQKRKAEMMLPPFEHHLKYDLSGYPQSPRKKPLSLFGRIICIADVFDAITAKRVYRSFSISPDRALGIMQEGSGKDFDPVLLKVFINMIGVYPIGTLLMLDNDEMGLVAKYGGESGDDKELWVQLLTTPEQGGFEKGELINLGPLNQETKSFNRPVLESLHPSAFNIQPADFIL